MSKLKEYDLAYICYYSERVELANIATGLSTKLTMKELTQLIQNLKDQELFDFYKSTYEEMLEE
ncbi:hypothetical protein CUC43_17970 [Bacillus thuringiensis LM1212]|uniref:hypothetical protein n=1 Tax=Bacillus cereus group TaxID=86661 RepID=UPI00040C4709|nr:MULTISPECIES: hypothetical protein [Bacillus cereus group]AXY08566.1 hypothetical protein CUC43_17970 [Bacillus thuringiensis LM1212]PGC93537.1 hypothetical protein COM39_08225 [Bacillus toyonensis]QDF26855.1 hypothetical protein FJR70_29740 [Bacillus tropicus]QUG94805.1 hypothetical protein HCM98_07620 [Bacillus tropicus]